MAKNFQKLLMKEVHEYLLPILSTRGNPDGVFALLQMFGWYIRPMLQADGAQFTDHFGVLISDVAAFADTVDDNIETPADLVAAFQNVTQVIDGIRALKQQLPNLQALPADQFVADVLNGLAVLYLHRNYPLVFELLDLLTLIRLEPPIVETNAGEVVRIRNKFAKLRFDKISDIVSDPEGVLRTAYWPNEIVDRQEAIAVAERLFPHIVNLLNAVSETAPIMASFGRGGGPKELPQDADEDRLSAMLTLWWNRKHPSTGADIRVGASIGILSTLDGGPGISVVPFGGITFVQRVGGWFAAASGDYDASGFKITASGITYYSGAGTVPHVSLVLAPKPGPGPALLIGSAGGTRLEAKQYWIEADAIFSKPDFEISLFLRLREGALVIDAGDGDGFLSKILPPEGLRVDFDLGLGWSNLRGFHIEGSGSFEFRVPLHLSLGPVEIPGLTIRMGFADDKLPVTIGCDVTAKLGPLIAVVENMGVRLDFSFPEGGGNLGPLNWDPKFKPPSGIGLSIDGGGFKGGGFISFEPELHRYAGLLELEFQSGFALKAIGLLDTILPGGEEGYSLLIIISAEFSPIQLSFGFTLNGVGGLLGLNRTTDIDVLRTGVKTGALNAILFPKDIVEHASQIISDLRQIFPTAADRFLFGPMAKIGWGTPTLVEIELGLIIEGMSPWRILLPGVVRLVLPSQDNAILKLQVNFLGTWEQDKKTITFYASLYDSSLLSMVLTGDMAFLMKYGDNPTFVVVAGGFHPCFAPPPLPFPPFARMGLVIRNDDSLRIVLSSYFAVTSNTAQFGCAVDFRAKEGKYSVEGHLGFDALFHFSPFSMAVDLAATMTLRRNSKVMFGVQVYASLTGPTPWSARGTATFTILKQDISFDFARVWGEQRNTLLESIDVLPLFRGALENRGNWETVAPETAQNLITLRPQAPGDTALLLRPDGALAVRQKVVPLDVAISLFGNRSPVPHNRFAIKRIRMGGQEVPHTSLRDEFAPAQFESLSDADKLSRKSFEMMPAGVRTTGAGLGARTSGAVGRPLGYETKIIDSRINFYSLPVTYAQSNAAFRQLLNGNYTSQSDRSYFTAQYSANPGAAIGFAQESYAVVGTNDLRIHSAGAAFGSQAEARDYLAGLVVNDPSLAGAIQVVPNYLVREAA